MQHTINNDTPLDEIWTLDRISHVRRDFGYILSYAGDFHIETVIITVSGLTLAFTDPSNSGNICARGITGQDEQYFLNLEWIIDGQA